MVTVLFVGACGESSSNDATSVTHSLQETTSSLQEVELVLSETSESPELALAIEKLSQSLESLSESISESNNDYLEMAKATRELAFINFLDTMVNCLTGEFFQSSLIYELRGSGHRKACLGVSVGKKFDSAFREAYEGNTSSLFTFFESQEFYDLFLKRLNKLNASD